MIILLIILGVFGGNVYSQKSYKQSNFSKLFSNLFERVTLVPDNSKANQNIIKIDVDLDFDEESENQQIEDWMLADNYFETTYINPSNIMLSYKDEIEESCRLESWMFEENYFDDYISESDQFINEKKELDRIQSWMLDNNYFVDFLTLKD